MSRFKFRLETLLRTRVADRQEKRVELAQAYRAETLLNEEADRLSRERQATRGAARDATGNGTINVDVLRSVHRHAVLLEAQSRLIQQRSAQLKEEIERRRVELVEADRRVRVLEKLRERHRELFHADVWKRELKELDEIALRSASQESG